MINFLPDIIKTFSDNSQKSVGSLIKSIKADKAQVAELVKSLSNFLEQLLDCHVRANNLYFTKYEDLKKSRSVESILA